MATRYFVTGGAGFIGSNFAHYLLEDESNEVVVFDKLTYAGRIENLEAALDNARFEFVHGDLCDRELIRTMLKRIDPDVIVHLAAESHVDRSIDGPKIFMETNVLGTFELLDGARACLGRGENGPRPRFVHVSTDEVFGSLGPEGHFTEESRYQPNSPYAASKAAADLVARSYHKTYGLPVIITNCSNNYGPYQFPEKLIPLVTMNALENKRLPVYGTGGNVRDWLFVRDHCEALKTAAQRGEPGETYNIGGNSEKTNLEVVQTICKVLDELHPRSTPYADLIEFVKDRPGHDFRYAIDASKIQCELGWRPATAFDEGIKKTIQWYTEHRGWCEKISQGVYGRERLGIGRGAA